MPWQAGLFLPPNPGGSFAPYFTGTYVTSGNYVTVSATGSITGLVAGEPVVISSNVAGSLPCSQLSTTGQYYVGTVANAQAFTITKTPGGSNLVLGNATLTGTVYPINIVTSVNGNTVTLAYPVAANNTTGSSLSVVGNSINISANFSSTASPFGNVSVVGIPYNYSVVGVAATSITVSGNVYGTASSTGFSTSGTIISPTAISLGVSAGGRQQQANSIAIGTNAGGSCGFSTTNTTIGAGTILIGANTSASTGGSGTANSIVIGYNANTSYSCSVTIGANSRVRGTGGITIGSNSGNALTSSGILIGSNILANTSGVSVTSPLIIGAGAGSCLYAGTSMIAIGAGAAKYGNNTGAQINIMIGGGAGAWVHTQATTYSISLGYCAGGGATASNAKVGNQSIAIGLNASGSGSGCCVIAIGKCSGRCAGASTLRNNNSVLIGTKTGSRLAGPNTIAIGSNAISYSTGFANMVAIGAYAGATILGNNAVAIGYGAAANNAGPQTISIGCNAVGNGFNAPGAIAIGTNVGNSPYYTVSISPISLIGNVLTVPSQYANALVPGMELGGGNTLVQIGASYLSGNYNFVGQQISPTSWYVNGNIIGNVTVNGSVLGNIAQGYNSIAIGANAVCQGQQASNSIAIGAGAARLNQGIGNTATTSVNCFGNAVAIGTNAGAYGQQQNTVAIGKSSGYSGQQGNGVLVGSNTGTGLATSALVSVANVPSQFSSQSYLNSVSAGGIVKVCGQTGLVGPGASFIFYNANVANIGGSQLNGCTPYYVTQVLANNTFVVSTTFNGPPANTLAATGFGLVLSQWGVSYLAATANSITGPLTPNTYVQVNNQSVLVNSVIPGNTITFPIVGTSLGGINLGSAANTANLPPLSTVYISTVGNIGGLTSGYYCIGTPIWQACKNNGLLTLSNSTGVQYNFANAVGTATGIVTSTLLGLGGPPQYYVNWKNTGQLKLTGNLRGAGLVGITSTLPGQGTNGVGVGACSAFQTQGSNAVALGYQAAYNFQGNNAIAIGTQSGYTGGALASNPNVSTSGNVISLYGTTTGTFAAGQLITGNGIGIVSITQVNSGNLIVSSNVLVNSGNLSIRALGGQSNYAAAIGYQAGYSGQGVNSQAIGYQSGYVCQNANAIAHGYQSGYSVQGCNSIAVGTQAGYTGQGPQNIAIGYHAGYSRQGGPYTGVNTGAVAIGQCAGYGSQCQYSVAVGLRAGRNSQGPCAVAIGVSAGLSSQKSQAIAIGKCAGSACQGAQSVAIGYLAGNASQATNSIILNASGNALNQTTANTFTVKPVRQVTNGSLPSGFYNMAYNPTTGEIIYWS